MPEINVSLACFPGETYLEAVLHARGRPMDPLLGALDLAVVQICPQNCGVLTPDYAEMLLEAFPELAFRLHANVRVLPHRQVSDLADFEADALYWRALADCSKALEATAYTAHAGLRKAATLDQLFDRTRAAADLFGCPVGVEGHYPTRGNDYLLSSWPEYRALLDAGVPYVIDLSHLNILAAHSRQLDRGLVQALLSHEHCIEVHLSGNDGRADQHQPLKSAVWWLGLLDEIRPGADIFYEGMLLPAH